MNMNLYNRELQDGYILKQIELYRGAASMAPVIIKTLQAYDKKVFNCKLEKALKEATGRYISAKKEYHNINIGYYEGSQHYTLASCKIDDLIDGKRINADLLIKDARERQQGHLKRAFEMETAYNNIDNTFKQLEAIKATLKGLLNPIPYEVKDVYRINYHL